MCSKLFLTTTVQYLPKINKMKWYLGEICHLLSIQLNQLWGLVAHELWRQRQADLEFKASPEYLVSVRTARTV